MRKSGQLSLQKASMSTYDYKHLSVSMPKTNVLHVEFNRFDINIIIVLIFTRVLYISCHKQQHTKISHKIFRLLSKHFQV